MHRKSVLSPAYPKDWKEAGQGRASTALNTKQFDYPSYIFMHCLTRRKEKNICFKRRLVEISAHTMLFLSRLLHPC